MKDIIHGDNVDNGIWNSLDMSSVSRIRWGSYIYDDAYPVMQKFAWDVEDIF